MSILNQFRFCTLVFHSILLGGLSQCIASELHQPEEGDFFDAFVAEQYAYDDNLFRLPSGSQYLVGSVGPVASRDDRIDSTSAGVEGQWTSLRQAIAFDAHVSDNRYAKNKELDNTSGTGSVMWNWRAGEFVTGQVGTIASRSLANFQNTLYYGRDLVDTVEYFADTTFNLSNRWNLTGGFNRVTSTQSAEAQNLNDFESKSGNFGFGYVTPAENTFGLNYEYTKGAYPHETLVNLDGSPFDRDYDASIGRFLVKYTLGANTFLEANVGFEKRDFPLSSVGSFSGNIWQATLTWQPSPKTEIITKAARQLTAYLDAESDYFISTGVSVATTWKVTEKIALALTVSSYKQDYLGPDEAVVGVEERRDRLSNEQIGVTYSPRHFVIFKINCNLQQRSSNLSQFPYDDKLISASITGKFL